MSPVLDETEFHELNKENIPDISISNALDWIKAYFTIICREIKLFAARCIQKSRIYWEIFRLKLPKATITEVIPNYLDSKLGNKWRLFSILDVNL